jgi:starch synthase
MDNLENRLDMMMKNRNATKIVLASPEIAYLPQEIDPAGIIKTGDGGGLAVITATMFEEAYRMGLDVIIVLPEYYDLFRKQSKLSSEDFEKALSEVAMHPNVRLVDDGLFLHADKVYDDSSYALDKIDIRRAIQFSKEIVSLGRELDRFFPDADKIFQLNDWSTALAAAGLRNYDIYGKIKTEMKWHNVFSAVTSLRQLNKQGFNTQRYHKRLYYTNAFPTDDHGKDMYRLSLDFLTSGFLAADQITGVSLEILQEALNGRLESIGVMKKYMGDMLRYRHAHGEAGVVPNEPGRFANPEINPNLKHNYGTNDIWEGKLKNRAEFQRPAGLDVDPDARIILWPHRLHKWKGIEEFLKVNDELMRRHGHKKLQIAYVANGEREYVNWIHHHQGRHRGRIAHMAFARDLSDNATAASDIIMMPSIYEPRGFPQLEGPRYGTWAIVSRHVSGVNSFDKNPDNGNGWIYENDDPGGIFYAVSQAMEFLDQPLEYRRRHLQRAREASLVEHDPARMLDNSIDVWEYMLDKNKTKKIVLRSV